MDRPFGDVPSGIAETVRSLDAAARLSPAFPHRERRRWERLLPWLALLLPLAIAMVGSWRDRWVQEDAFVNFRIIDNLVAGHGPVFNVGERVEAYTDPLWLFVVAGAHEIVRGVSLAWLSVILGLAGTAVGLVAGGRAVQHLVGRREDGVVLPCGLLIVSVVGGVWEFATSGLEMGMVFAWLGVAFWSLVRVEERRTGSGWCALVLGSGTLIRPELILMSVVFVAALAVVVASPGWHGPAGPWRRYLVPCFAAVALPLAYELWRMAYFALLVSNTALAKSANGSQWSQGLTYAWNFIAPYTLWIPLGLSLFLLVPRAAGWWMAHDRVGTVILAAPVLAGLLDALYVTRLGGDYQHARLLLPAFFAFCLPVVATSRQLRSLVALPIVGIVLWSVVCGGWLRYPTKNVFVTDHGIVDERSIWVAVSKDPNPIRAADYHDATGRSLTALARQLRSQGRQGLAIDITDSDIGAPDVQPARSALPVHLVTNLGAIGITGYTSGSDVFIFDDFSLANPIGSHFPADPHARTGHQKLIGPVWMIARFGTSHTQLPPTIQASSVASAHAALQCGDLASYLRAVTAPLTLSQALSDIGNSLTFTTMTVPSDPAAARRELCG